MSVDTTESQKPKELGARPKSTSKKHEAEKKHYSHKRYNHDADCGWCRQLEEENDEFTRSGRKKIHAPGGRRITMGETPKTLTVTRQYLSSKHDTEQESCQKDKPLPSNDLRRKLQKGTQFPRPVPATGPDSESN